MAVTNTKLIEDTFKSLMQDSTSTTSELTRPDASKATRFPSVEGVLSDIEAKWEIRGLAA